MHLVENQKFFHIPVLNKLPSLYKNTYCIWFQTVQSQLWKVSNNQDTKKTSLKQTGSTVLNSQSQEQSLPS